MIDKCEHDRGAAGYASLEIKDCPYCRISELEAQVEAPPDYKRFLRAIKLAEGNGPIEGKLWAWAWKMAALEAGGDG